MLNPRQNTPLEGLALVVVSALLGALAVAVTLLAADLVQGRGLNFASLISPDALMYFPALALGLAVTSLIWYSRRGAERAYRYRDGLVWGVVCFLLTATAVLLLSLPGILGDSEFGLTGTLFFVYIVGGVFALPAIFTVAPLALWLWHRTIKTLRP